MDMVEKAKLNIIMHDFFHTYIIILNLYRGLCNRFPRFTVSLLTLVLLIVTKVVMTCIFLIIVILVNTFTYMYSLVHFDILLKYFTVTLS